MLLNSASFASTISSPKPSLHRAHFRRPTINSKFISFDDIAQLSGNKVLVGAAVSAAIGQLSKPFTSKFLYGKEFDLMSAIQAGGFPSTHSSAVVATATSLGLERGFDDPVFGMAVVYAGLIMYDSQGVRREVGNHARTLNSFLPVTRLDSFPSRNTDTISAQCGASPSSIVDNPGYIVPEEPVTTEVLVRDEKQMHGAASPGRDGLQSTSEYSKPLKESIGHTEIEVIAGAFLGFLVSLAVYNTL